MIPVVARGIGVWRNNSGIRVNERDVCNQKKGRMSPWPWINPTSIRDGFFRVNVVQMTKNTSPNRTHINYKYEIKGAIKCKYLGALELLYQRQLLLLHTRHLGNKQEITETDTRSPCFSQNEVQV